MKVIVLLSFLQPGVVCCAWLNTRSYLMWSPSRSTIVLTTMTSSDSPALHVVFSHHHASENLLAGDTRN